MSINLPRIVVVIFANDLTSKSRGNDTEFDSRSQANVVLMVCDILGQTFMLKESYVSLSIRVRRGVYAFSFLLF